MSPRPANFAGYVHALSGQIVDGQGRPLLLRGMGVGNWLLPEGYMWKLSPGADSPRQIETLVSALIGQEPANRFWQQFRAAFFNEADVARIANAGFDHIRLPINGRLIQDETGAAIEEGLALIDQCIEWCRKHRVWLLLDLHGAPGGQTGTNIDDSPNNKPELFMASQYREQTIGLWQMLARRYRDETVVMGYDLLNEPLPNEWQHVYADELVALYKDLTRAIRDIDPHHLIMYEGSHWATNWSIFTEVWDSNSALQFHRYWMPPDEKHIAPYLEARQRLGLPIYMGEGGENNVEWLYAAHRLYEDHDIGWNFWPWKKIGTITSPASISAPQGWDAVVAYAQGGDLPDRTSAQATFDALIAAMRLDQCTWNAEVLRAILADRPRRLPAWGFGYRGAGRSFNVANGQVSAWLRGNEAAGIVSLVDGGVPEFQHTDGRPYAAGERLGVSLEPGDWLVFDIFGIGPADTIFAIDAEGDERAVEVHKTEDAVRIVAVEAMVLSALEIRSATA